MAATVTSPWGNNKLGAGAWALDSEEHEDELNEQRKNEIENNNKTSDFPSLSAAASAKSKKKKPQPVSLAAFIKPAPAYQPKGLTTEDLMNLPTGPRERTAEELDRSKLGGGFRSRYGDESSTSRWGSGRGSGDEAPRRGGFGRDTELGPSRADEVDDWGSAKKPISSNGFDRRERGERGERGGFFGSESKADESESWVSKKSFVPSEGRRFEGGRERERRGGFESTGLADAADNWGRKKEFGGNNGGAFDSLRERRGGFDSNGGGGADSEAWGRRREETNVGVGGGGARPRLNLQPRTLPVPETPPASEGQQNGNVVVAVQSPVVAKPRSSNPFGAARPREEVLKEKYGDDWKQIDEKIELAKQKEKEAALQNERSAFGGGRRGFGSGDGRRTPEGPPPERSWRRPGQDDFRPSSAGSTGKAETEVSDVAEDVQE